MVSRLLLVRREGFEPPAFWSVGCLKGKSESFRLRFVLFTAVRSADFPLFPSSPACSNSVLGQKWVRGCNIRRDWRTATLRHSPRDLSSCHKWRKRQGFIGVFVHHSCCVTRPFNSFPLGKSAPSFITFLAIALL